MPELPEVETIRRQLAPRLQGSRVVAVEVLDARWCAPLRPGAFARAVRGRVVERLTRRGKYLIWELEGGVAMLMHLRMTGTLLYDASSEPPHTRVRVELDHGHRLLFVDPRRFGTGQLAIDGRALAEFLAARLGVEPFSQDFTAAGLRKEERGSRAPGQALPLHPRQIPSTGKPS
ncbi:MAG: DNA-formamidopyrimidine glycosylase family protein, partial [Solirubrobacteraceae bacterium]